MHRSTIAIVTTVPETLQTILKGQPQFLSETLAVTLITSDYKSCKELAKQEGVSVKCVPMQRKISPIRDLSSLIHMTIALRKLKPTIVHSYTPKAGLLAMVGGLLAGCPTRIHTFTGLVFPTSRGIKKQILKLADRLVCACATVVIPEGQGVRRDLIQNRISRKVSQPIGAGNIAGVDTSFFNANRPEVQERALSIRQELKLQQGDFLFCFVGRLNRDKGIKELWHAFKSISPTAHLLLVGSEDLTSPVAPQIMDELRQHKRVHFSGFQADIRPFVTASDVVLLPSYREGFPNVLLQAAALSKPAIASNINGCNEIIRPFRTGWLVKARDSHALSERMQACMDLGAIELQNVGENARKYVSAKFEQVEYRRLLLDFYKQFCAPA